MSKQWKNTFRVGAYVCEMAYSTKNGIIAKWTPKPGFREVPIEFIDQYRAGRDALLTEVGKELGGTILVIET